MRSDPIPTLFSIPRGPPLERDLAFCFLFSDQYLHVQCDALSIQPLEKGLGMRNADKKRQEVKTQCTRHSSNKGRILLTQNNYNIFKVALERLVTKELQSKKKQTENNITAKQLYEQDFGVESPPIFNVNSDLFSKQEIERGIKKLGVGKAKDLVDHQAEYLNMIENRISKWAKENGKRAKGQASFRPKHSIVDHGMTLRHLIEKIWEEKEEIFYCFVDFKKAFDTVPRVKLWKRMEDLGIPIHLRVVVHGLYEEVKVKIRTFDGLSESFRSDIGVKQGCMLSPTLFGLYIDTLEEWLNSRDADGVRLGEFMIKILLDADDLIPIAKTPLGLRENLYALEHFCRMVEMQVNISKTKIMVFSNKW
ncbi:uncharacterized protein LOC131856598 [Cryptomeria japonica]|uniref:uncharacterized protein LOC131856598 n=1 Tax=Cryptomeria japonica TaxID=3369 RepID=UPI0027DA7F09|nr:uncharacterized protein LOC131856598 [Cryptomeria japonica]